MSAYRKPGGCWTDDPAKVRGRTTTSLMQDGYAVYHRGDHITREPVMRQVTTEWLPMACGDLPQVGRVDVNCRGCAHDKAK
jgi:hypothetical protein